MMVEMKGEEEGQHTVFGNEVVIRHLFSLLDVPTLKTCRLVNSSWKELSSATFFRRTVLDIHPIHLKQDLPYDEDYNWRNDEIAKSGWSSFLNFITKRDFHHPHIRMDYSFMLQLMREGTAMDHVLKGIKRIEFHGIEGYEYRDQGVEFLPHVTRILTHVGSQLEELSVQGECRMQDLDGSMFPPGINFSGLRALSLNLPCPDEHKLASFLSRIFKHVPNLEELSVKIRGWGLKWVLDLVDFTGLNMISKLCLETLNYSDFGVVDILLEKFVGLTSLTLKDVLVCTSTSNPGWIAFVNMLTRLSSMLTLKSLELDMIYLGPQYNPVFSVFKCFANLEELTLRVDWHRMDGPEGNRSHWEAALDEINCNKLFPKLKKLTLQIEPCSKNFGNTVSAPGENLLGPPGSVCPTLRQLIITCPDLEKCYSIIRMDAGIRNKLYHKFPNAKICLMGKFVDPTLNTYPSVTISI